jgi:hypothetical protein
MWAGLLWAGVKEALLATFWRSPSMGFTSPSKNIVDACHFSSVAFYKHSRKSKPNNAKMEPATNTKQSKLA